MGNRKDLIGFLLYVFMLAMILIAGFEFDLLVLFEGDA